jgi:hypothetical protein
LYGKDSERCAGVQISNVQIVNNEILLTLTSAINTFGSIAYDGIFAHFY